MAIQSIYVPIAVSDVTSEEIENESEIVLLFAEELQRELAGAFPSVRVVVVPGFGAPRVVATSEEEKHQAIDTIGESYNHVMGRHGTWREQLRPRSRRAEYV